MTEIEKTIITTTNRPLDEKYTEEQAQPTKQLVDDSSENPYFTYTSSKTGKEVTIFEEETALAILLQNEVVFLNSFYWKSPKHNPDSRWTEYESEYIAVGVAVSDTFYYASADVERLPYFEIQNLYDMWVKDPYDGPAVWAMKQRRMPILKPILERVWKDGIFDLSEFDFLDEKYRKPKNDDVL